MIIVGDCLEALRTLEAGSVDSLVTDPPAGIGFMGKDWDGDRGGRAEWVTWLTGVMREALRVLKPGAHGLVWALPRTSHWTATALEDAGFEVRDVIVHAFGTGFPKSLDVSKAIDKAAGAERPVVGITRKSVASMAPGEGNFSDDSYQWKDEFPRTAPATDAARQWAGWGTALKPASEHWILVRKPLDGTVAANVQAHGTGALNIDGCRVGTEATTRVQRGTTSAWEGGAFSGEVATGSHVGRWPANLILSHAPECEDAACALWCPVREMDAQSGVLKSGGQRRRTGKNDGYAGGWGAQPDLLVGPSDSGGASRFFYRAKPSTSERNAGLPAGARNVHPTVKSRALMTYLIRLITPPGGLVLDPFAGSGSTGVAAVAGGWRFLGIEREPEYAAIAEARIREAA